jgi:hypothetical protein
MKPIFFIFYNVRSYNHLYYYLINIYIYIIYIITEYIGNITPGIYNSDNIVTAVKTAIEATGFGGTVTVTFSKNTKARQSKFKVDFKFKVGLNSKSG